MIKGCRRGVREKALRDTIGGNATDAIGIIAQPIVYEKNIAALQEKITNFNSDLLAFHAATDLQKIDFILYKLGWRVFVLKWETWRDQHNTFLSRVGQDAYDEFNKLQAQYNEHLRQFTETFKGKTTANKSTETDGSPGSDFGWVKNIVVAGVIIGGGFLVLAAVREARSKQ